VGRIDLPFLFVDICEFLYNVLVWSPERILYLFLLLYLYSEIMIGKLSSDVVDLPANLNTSCGIVFIVAPKENYVDSLIILFY
jgi:hypothetical protein